jgi:hypothetical protein
VADSEFVGRLVPELDKLLPMLDERSRRLVLGAVAGAAGDGGVTAVAHAAGASWQTVADGKAELDSGESAPPGRIRRPGAGRKPLTSHDPGLRAALGDLVGATVRGDPMSPLLWTTLSLRQIARELTARGHACSKNTVRRLLLAEGFSLQGNSRTIEGMQHPDRDGQFRYISGLAGEFLAAGDPVISVDTKKKELVGQYGQDGRSWRPAEDPVPVRDHDFPDPELGKAIPYGIYDIGRNEGFVNVGTDHDTAAFAVASIGGWWAEAGSVRYPGARRLLITADAGGSNSYRTRGWKAQLAALAAGTGLEIWVCHFPPGTSKWNKIEHRLFCHITRTWRARPLASHQVIIDTIAATTTSTGLTVTARLDLAAYPEGTQVSNQQWRHLQEHVITRHEFHGDWNYTISPAPAPEPEPASPAGPAGLWPQILPALTGMTSSDLDSLASSLETPFAAAREQRLHLRRGHPRRYRSGPSSSLSLHGIITAALARHRHAIPWDLLARLSGTGSANLRVSVRDITPLLDRHTTRPAPGRPIRNLTDLQEHATATGITIPAGLPQHRTIQTAPHRKLTLKKDASFQPHFATVR